MFLLLILCFVINFASEPKGISTRAGKRRQGQGSPASSASASATELSSLAQQPLAPSSNVAAASPDLLCSENDPECRNTRSSSTSSQRATRSSGQLGMQQGVMVAGVVTPPQAGSPATSGWGGSPATPGNVVMAPSSAEASKDVVMTQAEEKPTLPLAPAGSSAAAGSSSRAAQSSAESSGGDVVMAQPAPGSYDPMQQPSIPGFNQLLRACFDATHVKEHGTPPSYPLDPSRVAESMQRVWGAARVPPPRSGPGSGAGSSAGSSGSSGAPQIASSNADVHNFQGFFLVALFLTVFLANLRKWKEHHDQVYVSFEDQA